MRGKSVISFNAVAAGGAFEVGSAAMAGIR